MTTPSVSPDVVILTREELKVIENLSYQRGVERGKFESVAPAGEEWRCPKCGATADERFDCCEVHAATAGRATPSPKGAEPVAWREALERIVLLSRHMENVSADNETVMALVRQVVGIHREATTALASAPVPEDSRNKK